MLLAPDLKEGIVEGRANPALILEWLELERLPRAWAEQRRVLLGGDRG